MGVGRFHQYNPIGDTTEWDERDYLTPNTTQEAMQFQAPAVPSEANVEGFLQQAERMERELKPRTDNDDIFDQNEDTDVPF